jgi:hypothetical protein
VQNLGMLRQLDPDWAWSQLEHVLAKEKTRGVVGAAIEALANLAYQNIPRAIRAAKGVLRRYKGKNGPGMATCQSLATTLIFDFHIFGVNTEADKFAVAITSDVRGNADTIRQLIARYSNNLLAGSVDDPEGSNNQPRLKTLALYHLLTEKSFCEIDERISRLDVRAFDSWPESDQATVRSMFGILDEVTLRLHLAVGARHDGSRAGDEISPERARLYTEAKPILARLAIAAVAPIAHHLIQTLETFIPLDPSGIFALIAQSVKSADQGGYSTEPMAADLIVRIVERYLADYRSVFVDHDRMSDLMDCLDAFVRAGWPSAQSLTFRLAEIWR